MREVSLAPDPSALLESLRDIGYSPGAAVADLIDNSISAKALNIDVLYQGGEEPSIAICDDGTGMDEKTLIAAMRPGSLDPRLARNASDLGRFGLGLKTASFSQARRLTVVSRKGGAISAARWDLDRLDQLRQWSLEVLEEREVRELPAINRIGNSGTLVVWQKLDRISAPDLETGHASLDELMHEVRRHIELVFHRFLKPSGVSKPIRIRINDREVCPANPFGAGLPGRQVLARRTYKIGSSTIEIQPYVLPHPSKLSAAELRSIEHDEALLNGQGFYVYRGRRLLVWGTWFRLLRRAEVTKLLRIQVDLPNNLDKDWSIDVRKSRAEPPRIIREWLKLAISQIELAGRRVVEYRGRASLPSHVTPVWNRVEDRSEIRYSVNRDHPLISGVASRLGSDGAQDYEHALRVIEQCLPIVSIYTDAASNPATKDRARVDAGTYQGLFDTLLEMLRSSGVSRDDALALISATEPFCLDKELFHRAVEEIDQ